MFDMSCCKIYAMKDTLDIADLSVGLINKIFLIKQHLKMAQHNELGKWGEDVAAEYLRGKGYSILERDWHSGHRDIDIIAIYQNYLVFVEVKTRTSDSFVAPETAVDYKKTRNLRASINHYLRFSTLDLTPRFDIITVVGRIGSTPKINHIDDIPLM